MSFPIFRFTLFNETEGELQISEPGGWNDAKIKLERNEKYHSLVELYEQPLTFYGENASHNGGLDYIHNIEQTQGVDADVKLTIELDFGDGYETLFIGLLDLSQLKEFDGYKADIPVIREDAWTKFINRSNIPVDLQSVLDEDGNSIEPITPLDLTLTNQKVSTQLVGSVGETVEINLLENTEWLQVDNTTVTVSEIETKYTIPIGVNPSLPVNLFSMLYDGEYTFDFRFEVSDMDTLASVTQVDPGFDFHFFYQLNDNTPIQFAEADTANSGNSTNPGFTAFTYNTGTVTLSQGDEIRVYATTVLDFQYVIIWGTDGVLFTSSLGSLNYPSGAQGSWITGSATTTYDSTQSDTLLLHDAAESITKRISGMSVKSDYMGGPLTTSDNVYEEDGCAYPFTLMKGLHIRQYSFTDKPFSLSFDDFWKGVDPIFCLGLGYEQISPLKQFENNEFTVSITDWEQDNQGATLQLFTWDASGSALADGAAANLSDTARFGQTIDGGWPEGDYVIEIKVTNLSTGGSAPLESGLQVRGSNTSIGDGSSTLISYGSTVSWEVGESSRQVIRFTTTQDWDYLSFDFYKFGVGAGYECKIYIDYIKIIQYQLRIEDRGHFYDTSANSVNLYNINNIERSYAIDRIFKKIEIGYQKWESENISGIDDPQTKHTYATGFRKVGEELEAYSKFIAASYAIESTRRQALEKSKDYRLDNDTFIIAVNPNASPVVPELDENFVSVAGLNNAETRYNLRITPYWNFTNWVQYLSGSFRPLNSAYWKFQSGEGNYGVQYIADNECLIQFGSGTQGEGDDISVSNLDTEGYMFALDVWEFEHPLNWTQYKVIRDNKNNSIGLSETGADPQSFFILSLEYEITKGKAKFRCLKAGVDAPPPAILDDDYIIEEDGDAFEMEDGSGFILME